MAIPRDWSPAEAVANCLPATPWSGEAWRGHNRRYDALSSEGSLRRSGRYHRAAADFPDFVAWPALYLSLSREGAMAETLRYASGQPLVGQRYSRIRVTLTRVLHLTDVNRLGVLPSWLISSDYEVPQLLALAARELAAEGVTVLSAASPTEWQNLVIFPDMIGQGSRLEIIETFDPNLVR